MGKGTSKASAGGGNTAKSVKLSTAQSINDNQGALASANLLYGIDRTGAFPSSDTIIKNVPSLARMKQAMEEAPIGTSVGFTTETDFRSGGNGDATQVRFFEKTGERTWTMTDLKKDSTGEFKKVGGGGEFQGKKLLQIFSSDHYRDIHSVPDSAVSVFNANIKGKKYKQGKTAPFVK